MDTFTQNISILHDFFPRLLVLSYSCGEQLWSQLTEAGVGAWFAGDLEL